MDNLSVNDFSSSFTDTSSRKENFNHLSAEEVTYAALYPSRGITVDRRTPLEKPYNFILKRSFDILVSIILIILILSWLIPLLAILIKLDSKGPIFFLQKRNKNGGPFFSCIKFRTMIVNDEADILAAEENDKRITKSGRFLRHYHLDELPQLLNVLIGDMSIIGPRPYMVNENSANEKLIHGYSHRHSVKPGITGLAQSMGNFGATQDVEIIRKRVDLDVKYIRNWSFIMDIKIIYRTCRLVLGI